MLETPAHAVQFYEGEEYLCTSVAEFVAKALADRQPVVVIATGPHLSAIRDLLDERLDFHRAVQGGDITFLDADTTLASLMANGQPSWDLFTRHVGGIIRKARASHGEQPVRAYGEMVDVLWRRGEAKSAIRLEEMWNELGKREHFALLCGYSLSNFRAYDDAADFQRVCAIHSHVHPAETSSSIEGENVHLELALLQQRAKALEAEVQHRAELERELREQREELLRRQQELTDFVENGIEGIHWVGPDGTILYANKAELEMLGYSREEYIGRHIREFHADARVIGDILTRLSGGQTLRDYEARLRCKDGSIRHVLIHSNVYWRDGRFVHTRCFTRDITDRKRAEEKLREQSRINEDLVRIGSVLSSELDVESLMQKVINETTSLCRAQFGGFFYDAASDEHRNSMLCAVAGASREAFATLPLSIFEPRFGGRNVMRVADVTREPRFTGPEPHPALPTAHMPVRSYLAVPVLLPSGEGLGGLFFGHAEPEAFNETDEKLVTAVAGQAAVALENARLLQATRRSEQTATRERERLEQIARELETANRTKDDFLATVSHELRTPLNAILGWARMLRTGGLPADKTEKALETIERNANAQAQLIEDLLDVSRIISGKLRLEMEAVDLPSVVENAVEAIRPAADVKGISIHQVMDPSAGPTFGDPGRLQQVVWNLLTNAVKFTPRGGSVQIAVRKSGASIEVIVTDTGQGIDPEFLPRVFERFRQADATPSRKYGGLGLGLAIVRHLVELHGGSVKVASDGLDRGTTFTICLPIAPLRSISPERPPALRLSTTPPFTCPEELEGLDIVVVDDEPDARGLLFEMLTSCKARVAAAASSKEAIRLVQELRPDIVISDIGMPEEDGYALIEKLRALPEHLGGRTPAVALTAYARFEDRSKALVAGFNMHVPKPVEPAELLAVLSGLARMFPRTRARA